MQRTCQSCHATFDWVSTRPNGKGRPAQYCSDHCRKYQPIPCAVCGTVVIKNVGKGATSTRRYVCSDGCRTILQYGSWAEPLPPDHWARWYGATSPWAPPEPQPRFASCRCEGCAAWFVADQQVRRGSPRFCTLRCKRRQARRRRTAREHNATGQYTWIEVIELFLKFHRCCAYCDQPIDGQPDPDHVTPLSRGGCNDISNILPSCRLCNSDKADLTLSEWESDRKLRGKPSRRYSWAPDDQRFWHVVMTTPLSDSRSRRNVA